MSMSRRNNVNFEFCADGRIDTTFMMAEAICPKAFRHGDVARKSRKLRRAVWNAAYDAVAQCCGSGVSDSNDFNIFLGWTGLVISYCPGYGWDDEYYDNWEIKLPIVTLKDCLRGYKRPSRSGKKMYTSVYNAVRAALQ